MSMNDRRRELARAADVDVLVAMSPENFTWASGAWVLTVASVRPRHAYAVIPREGQPVTLVCSIEENTMRDESWIEDVQTYTEFADEPVLKLAELLKARGWDKGRIGIDLAYLPQTAFAGLAEALPGASFVDTTEAVAAVRAIKEPHEIEIMEQAARSTHEAVLDGMAASRLGDTEKMMADRIANGMVSRGADTGLFVCFASGERTRMAHAMPTDRVPKESEVIRFDVGARYREWMSDFARTYSTGSPTQQQKDTYRSLVRVHKETIVAVRPGVRAEDLFFLCKESFGRHGIAFHMPHIGHSFGVELHENPMIRPGDKTRLAPGMVINIEPFVFDPDRIGYHVEDLFVVTEDGYRLLTLGFPPEELPVIGQPIPR
jgi:Xaa-Pro dipeptidase